MTVRTLTEHMTSPEPSDGTAAWIQRDLDQAVAAAHHIALEIDRVLMSETGMMPQQILRSAREAADPLLRFLLGVPPFGTRMEVHLKRVELTEPTDHKPRPTVVEECRGAVVLPMGFDARRDLLSEALGVWRQMAQWYSKKPLKPLEQILMLGSRQSGMWLCHMAGALAHERAALAKTVAHFPDPE